MELKPIAKIPLLALVLGLIVSSSLALGTPRTTYCGSTRPNASELHASALATAPLSRNKLGYLNTKLSSGQSAVLTIQKNLLSNAPGKFTNLQDFAVDIIAIDNEALLSGKPPMATSAQASVLPLDPSLSWTCTPSPLQREQPSFSCAPKSLRGPDGTSLGSAMKLAAPPLDSSICAERNGDIALTVTNVSTDLQAASEFSARYYLVSLKNRSNSQVLSEVVVKAET